jgi:hypothetical protein
MIGIVKDATFFHTELCALKLCRVILTCLRTAKLSFIIKKYIGHTFILLRLVFLLSNVFVSIITKNCEPTQNWCCQSFTLRDTLKRRSEHLLTEEFDGK